MTTVYGGTGGVYGGGAGLSTRRQAPTIERAGGTCLAKYGRSTCPHSFGTRMTDVSRPLVTYLLLRSFLETF